MVSEKLKVFTNIWSSSFNVIIIKKIIFNLLYKVDHTLRIVIPKYFPKQFLIMLNNWK